MLNYNELYEILRKEKYSEQIQELPKNFLEDYKEYLYQQKTLAETSSDIFFDSITKSRKQLENAISLFRELMLKRKKKILNLVFIATETGVMKKDYENMLQYEKEIFETMIKTFENSDANLSTILNTKETKKNNDSLILFTQNVDAFLNHDGNFIGPFSSGDVVNLNSDIAKILIEEKKASYVDEK